MNTHPIVIVGASAAGIAVLSTLRRLLPQVSLICIDQESYKPYNTCLLVSCLAQSKNFSDTQLLPTSWYSDPLITWHLGTRVTALNTQNKSVILHTGQEISYSKLLLTVGIKPALAPEHKAWLEKYHNILTFYNATDLHILLNYIREHGVTRVAVVGAGLTGIECADALSKLNIGVWLIESQKSILSHLLDEQAGLWLLQKIPATLTVLTGTWVQTVYAHDTHSTHGTHIKTLVVNTGQELQELPVQLVILATGVQPAIELAEQAGLALCQVGTVRGIAVDESFQTSCAEVYAAGDCAVYGLLRSNTWAEALTQGTYAARALADASNVYPEYKGVVNCATTTLFGVPLGYCNRRVMSGAVEYKLYWQYIQDEWCGVFVQVSSGVLQGGVVIGSLQKLQHIKQACQIGTCYQDYLRTSI